MATSHHANLAGQTALITGATAGIGAAVARHLAQAGCNLVLTGRRKERLELSAAALSTEFGVQVQTLAFDVTKRSEVEQTLSSANLANVSIVINNAGLALGSEPMHQAVVDDWDTMIDTNVKGLLYVTRAVVPHMIARGGGHVVNIGSVAGRWTYPGGGVYCATKFAVRALTECLRLDLLGKPIRVTNVEPGMVETEFSEVRYRGDKAKAKSVYDGMKPLSPDDIAETVVWTLARPAHVNVQEIVIFPTDQAAVGPYVARHARREN